MTAVSDPKLAVVVVTDRYAAIERLVDCLRAQDVRDQIELVVAVPADGSFALPQLPEFARAGVVEVKSLDPLPAARAAAVRAAAAPFVFVGETHSLPRPGWAAATIAAHEGGAAVVVPAICNGNPSDAVSWACLIMDYGRWLASGVRREVDQVPGYNTSYRREALLELGPRLDELLEQESGVASELRRRGGRVCFEPDAQVDHLDISRRLHWVRDSFLVGRVLATTRIRRWSRLRRIAYFAGAPLIPLVMLWRLHNIWPRRSEQMQPPRSTLPAFVAVSTVLALGEMSGYASPASRAELERMMNNELHRELYLSRAQAS
jgi:hypothetical protein